METKERGFKGIWIPAEIWLSTKLSMIEKVVLAEIDSLNTENKGCFASNAYLAEFCQCSERKISEAIATLKELNFITTKFDGRTREIIVKNLQSRVAESARQSRTKQQAYNIIDNNNKENIYNIYIKEKTPLGDKPPAKKFIPPTLEEVKAYIKEKNMRNVSAEEFFYYYDGIGWKVGKNTMKNWKSALSGWNARNDGVTANTAKKKDNDFYSNSDRHYTEEELESLFDDFV